MNEQPHARLKALLDGHHNWPEPYTFKFIVPQARLADVVALLPDETPVIRPSAKGAYVSVSFTVTVDSAEAVVAVYQRAGKIEGIMSL